MKLLTFNASSSDITISIELDILNLFSIMVEQQIAIVDVPAKSAYT